MNNAKELVVGSPIEFYDQGSHEWVKGKISDIQKKEGFFMYAQIDFWAHRKQQTKIYREDWLR